MAIKRDEQQHPSAPTRCCEKCGGPYQWTNGRLILCWKCYEMHVYPAVPATPAEIAGQKKLRDVERWIDKHPEFKTKREACLHALKVRGLAKLLPEKLRE